MIKKIAQDFPGGSVVKNLPANAGDTGSSPGPGRSHMPVEQLSLCATTTEARVPRARAPQQEKPPQWEARAPQPRVAPPSSQLEKARAQQQWPNAAKNNK